ncbi:MAG: DUF429 domain-containing protein [Limnochordaceae bacterium]|nr:DUF429 domain-containing protein [Limnochordaceae bacterium]
MRYIGVDLAWSGNRPSGIVVLGEQGDVESWGYLVELSAIASFCLAASGEEPAIVAVDAPLEVPNETGQRPAERALLRLFAERRLGAHVVSRRRLLSVHGSLRGEDLARLLRPRFVPDGGFAGSTVPPGLLIEVYPHAALIAWFDLPKPLEYKRGPLERRSDRLRRLVELLRRLGRADPPLDLERALWIPGDDEWEGLTGIQADQIEALLDALICAHVARYCRRWGQERCTRLGGPGEGSILTPLPPAGSGPPASAAGVPSPAGAVE